MIKIPAWKWRTAHTRAAIIIIAGALLLALALEAGFNWRLTALVRRSFLQEPAADSRVEVAVSWMSIKDIIQGRVGPVRIKSWNCKLGKLRYQRLEIESQGVTFDFPVLLKEKRLQVARLQRTRIKATVTETAFQEYLTSAYPDLKPQFKIVPAGIELSARASVFGNSLPVVLEGQLGVSSPNKLRFFPKRLMVAGRPVVSSFIQLISKQLPLEFSIINEWPLEITGIRLEQGILFLSLKELKS
ncbi:MAG TPA: hypothetical protein VHY08_04045 [Bacillota bacterium]|nr:hypothetical protein [Bacillota bacterium]